MKTGEELCYIIAFYKSPNQLQNEFEKFSEELELNLGILVQKASSYWYKFFTLIWNEKTDT